MFFLPDETYIKAKISLIYKVKFNVCVIYHNLNKKITNELIGSLRKKTITENLTTKLLKVLHIILTVKSSFIKTLL